MYEVFNWGYTNDEPPKRFSLSIVGSEINIDGPPLPTTAAPTETANTNATTNISNTKNTVNNNNTENNHHNNHHYRQYSNHNNFYTSSAKGEDAV